MFRVRHKSVAVDDATDVNRAENDHRESVAAS
ncbi:hypothetical protein MPLB_1690026 [Mesorhizobium sp. ORS 3324]|nr:hypothetical protein MPLB_1690026 [Mesorhizobium sp. ORS 3324]